MIPNKIQMYQKLLKGDFGPTNPHFLDINSWNKWMLKIHDENHWERQKWGLRTLTPGAKTLYDLTANEIKELWHEGLVISPMTPNNLITIQGEVCISYTGVELYYSLRKESMKPALKTAGQYAKGIMALEQLKYSAGEENTELITSLLHEYHGCAVEFTCYAQKLNLVIGEALTRASIIIWEVRNY